TDLIQNGRIPDPWVGLNELEVQWVENEDWEYSMEFEVSNGMLKKHRHDLIFEGLDTYANVFLNDSLILSADNMFRTWKVPVENLLRIGNNNIRILFKSPIQINKSKLESLGYELPASNEPVEHKVSPFTRKAPYHFGWDWGPRLVTAGVWRPVFIESWNEASIRNVQIIQNELSQEYANLEVVVEIESISNQQVELEVLDKDTLVSISSGMNEIHINVAIENPKFWWPNGWGDPYLYEIPVMLSKDGNLIDDTKTTIGLRTVELVQKKDSIGESFYFKVNGEPLFARGANYIPQSHFLPSVKKEQYGKLIKDAKEANMNMIRVWGGGIYEDDLFYQLCDKNGILVWQDFMFACSMYPGDSSFLKNVEAEVIDNVKRLRNHPSIVHWNGNNEVDVAWNNWGWQNKYGFSKADSTTIWNDYLTLFHDKIPSLLEQLDNRSYTTTSPLSNWGKLEYFNDGSMHYWGVWHGGDEFEDYYTYVGRFMSEYGFQSFPNMETIKFYADSADLDIDSEVMRHHQKSYVGNGMINKQVEKYFAPAVDFVDFVEKSQLAQTLAMSMAIDGHRVKKGHCWGTLFWQLNDCWPGPSWSAIDVFGRKKIFYDNLSELYNPVAVIPVKEQNQLVSYLVNDKLEEFEGELVVKKTFNSEVVKSSIPILSKANAVEVVLSLDLKGLEKVELQLFQNSNLIHQRTWIQR
ncbi:MAG: glycoside hydrolase family 2 protein, partial [Bacteroidota bacterium]